MRVSVIKLRHIGREGCRSRIWIVSPTWSSGSNERLSSIWSVPPEGPVGCVEKVRRICVDGVWMALPQLIRAEREVFGGQVQGSVGISRWRGDAEGQRRLFHGHEA